MNGLSFSQKYDKSKCRCEARFMVCEKRSKLYIEPKNLAEIDKIKVDGCLHKSQTTHKCDYLFVYKQNDHNRKFIFVELKGSDVNTAFAQIKETLTLFKNEHLLNNVEVRGVIVLNSNPLSSGSLRVEKLKLKKEFKNILHSFDVLTCRPCTTYDCSTDKLSS
ncbi:MAG: hypothetical protein LBV74_22825 [Tannerella sp.]|jgi:hypothetical protein|nr:hypothetical protein [Tannerella sp.]